MFTVCIAITMVAYFIINQQNRNLVHTDMINSISVIQDSLLENQTALSETIFHMATLTKMGNDVKFLGSLKDITEVTATAIVMTDNGDQVDIRSKALSGLSEELMGIVKKFKI